MASSLKRSAADDAGSGQKRPRDDLYAAATVLSSAPTTNMAKVASSAAAYTAAANSSPASNMYYGSPSYAAAAVTTTKDVGLVAAAARTKAKIEASKAAKKDERQIVRAAGGESWKDDTLKEWDDNDFRIFVGDLGKECNDEVLAEAFAKYPSFLKARVVKDKHTGKNKGFGFVSFKDPDDYTKAMREMNGKYVGSRPVKLRKSTWQDRNLDNRDPNEVAKLHALKNYGTGRK